jgi:hypothetical protein
MDDKGGMARMDGDAVDVSQVTLIWSIGCVAWQLHLVRFLYDLADVPHALPGLHGGCLQSIECIARRISLCPLRMVW